MFFPKALFSVRLFIYYYYFKYLFIYFNALGLSWGIKGIFDATDADLHCGARTL